MSLPDFSVKRPVTIIMIFLGIGLFGLISWMRLPQELYPPITYPQLSVVTFYKDAAPEEMEALITKPVEEAIGTVSGVRRISSTSKEETSLVVAEFNWGTNMDFAALGVREKIDLIKESLPRGSDDPIVMKYNPFELPLLVLNITAEKTTPGELQSVVKKIIKNELEKADGVAACNITGGITPEVLIEIDQGKLASKEVALNEVVEFISKANLNYPAGTIEESFYEYLIRTIGEFQLTKEMEDVVVGVEDEIVNRGYTEFGPEDIKQKEEEAIREKRLVLLKDIAVVKETFKDKTSISRYKGRDNISLSIQKQADANTLRVANNVRSIIARIKKIIPNDIKIDTVYDQSAFISSAIRGVTDSAWQGGLLAFLVLFFFLRSAKSAAIVTVTIPISILLVFSLMYFGNISLNMISLGGLALGVGMLVDAGIVVVENIYRYREEEKKGPKEASILGTNEVSGAVAGSVLTTVVVFLPMMFVIGIAGQLFKELAFTVTFSLLGSWIVAMTLIPILSATEKKAPDISSEGGEGLLGRMLAFMYRANDIGLNFFLNNRLLCITAVLAIFIGSCLLVPLLDTELMPKIDQGQFIIKFTLPPGTRLQVSDDVAKEIEKVLSAMAEVDNVTVNIGSSKEKKGTALLETMGPNEGQIIVNLKPLAGIWAGGKGFRSISTADVLQKLKNIIKDETIDNAQIEYILQESVFKTAFQGGTPIVIEIKGQDLTQLRNIAAEASDILTKISGVYNVKNSLIDPAPEIKVNVFKEKATAYNLSVTDIALTGQTAIKGYLATKFKKEGEEIDVRVRLRKQDRDNLAKVTRLMLHSPLGVDVPLSELAYFTHGRGPTEIERKDQERVVIVSANIYKRSFKDVAGTISSGLKTLSLPSGYTAELTGEREQMDESFNSLRLALILSVVLVFMIMASQFESLWQPFVIMLTIPLSLIGVILALLLTNTPISVMVLLGFIILGGIVVDNAIVLVDYINILVRQEKLPTKEAVILASKRRLRPILMTSLTTILGLVPLGLALDEGSKLQQPMAITVMGGLIVTTFLSLVFIPTVYLTWEDFIVFVKRKIFGVEIISPLKPMELALEAEVPIVELPPKHLALTPVIEEEVEEPKPHIKSAFGREEVVLLPPEEKKEKPVLPPQATEKPTLPAKKPEEKLPPPVEKLEAKPKEPPVTAEKPPLPEKKILPKVELDALVQRQQDLITYLRANKKITRQEYSEKFNISVPTAARDLKFLSDKGILVAKGPAAVGRYYVLKEGV